MQMPKSKNQIIELIKSMFTEIRFELADAGFKKSEIKMVSHRYSMVGF